MLANQFISLSKLIMNGQAISECFDFVQTKFLLEEFN